MTALKKMARSDAMRFAAELARDREFRRDLRRAGRKAAALGERRDLLSASGRKELGRRSAALAADVERALRRVERRRRGRRRARGPRGACRRRHRRERWAGRGRAVGVAVHRPPGAGTRALARADVMSARRARLLEPPDRFHRARGPTPATRCRTRCPSRPTPIRGRLLFLDINGLGNVSGLLSGGRAIVSATGHSSHMDAA